MKKITLFAAGCFMLTGIMNGQELTTATPIHHVQLPAAYYNSNLNAVGEGTASISPNALNVEIPYTGSYHHSRSPQALIYDNGPLFNEPGPPMVSFLQDASLGMGTYGFAASFVNGFSIADDFILSEGADITSIDVFTYQTGSVPPSITAVYMEVWDGDPSDLTSTVIWGDLFTDVLFDAQSAEVFRQLESAPGDQAREIQRVTAATDGLSLTAGTYWVEYSFEGSGASGPWAPPIVITGQSNTGNALQNLAGVYSPVIDIDPQGFPFQIFGDIIAGIDDNSISNIVYYPNPTNGILNLTANTVMDSISVFNMLGQQIMTQEVNSTIFNIDLSSLNVGTYILKVSGDGQSANYKVLKN